LDDSFLNDSQKKAVRHGSGPMMALAGPGSGKTTVITYRIQSLIEDLHIDPTRILVITFTKSATEEMRRRFLSLDAPGGGKVTFSTFHALFYKIIRARYRLDLKAVLRDSVRKEAVRRILASMRIDADDELLQGALNEISWIKNDLADVRYYHSMSLGSDDFQQVYARYEKWKEEQGVLDFDDMLVKCHALFCAEPDVLRHWQEIYHYILIDEFQDINQAQYRGITLMAEPRRNLFIVGDDDQSIYKFRGAKPEFLLRFPTDYPETAKAVLDTNYRSTDPIIQLCNQVIAHNQTRYSKAMTGIGRDGPKPVVMRSGDVTAEALAVAETIKKMARTFARANVRVLDEIAVIYRTNIQSRALTDAFMNLNIAYQIRDEAPSIYEHWIAKDIYAYLRLSYDRDANDALTRVINKPKRYIPNAVVASTLRESGQLLDRLYHGGRLQVWQRARVEELMHHLNQIHGMTTAEAVKYIRRFVGYDEFIRDYSAYRKIPSNGLHEILDELQEAAKAFPRILDFTARISRADAAPENNDNEPDNYPDDCPDDRPKVTLSTMHSVKGLEFETVFLIGAVEGSIPHEKSKTASEIEEERRLLYVGLTRAKTNLFISVVNGRYETKVKPTRFLDEILWKAEPRNRKTN
jgi:DNA helicase-2/ATP-dependent DNA helicase PcrA